MMEKDGKRLLKLYDLLEDAILGFEKVGKLDDWDKDLEVEGIYKELEALHIDIYSMLKDMGIDPMEV